MVYSHENGPNLNAPETPPERAARLQPLCDTILTQGFHDAEATLHLMDWAGHPDCPDDDFDRIIGVLQQRTELFTGNN